MIFFDNCQWCSWGYFSFSQIKSIKQINNSYNVSSYICHTSDAWLHHRYFSDILKFNYLQGLQRGISSKKEIENIIQSNFAFPEYVLYEYMIHVDTNTVLTLTTDPTYQALGIRERVVRNEWSSVNKDFDIPTASQILAARARLEGYTGIMYTSVRNQGELNLVLFEEQISNAKCQLVNTTDLDDNFFNKFSD